MDDFLPLWAQPHRFALLEERQRDVFTFGLVLTDLHLLNRLEGVRFVGRRYGYEWLPGLSAGVQRELETELAPSALASFLLEEHGMLGPRELSLDHSEAWDGRAGEPSDAILRSFAETQGAQIRSWSQGAFKHVGVNLVTWARARERVPRGHEALARQRLQVADVPHRLTQVHASEGSRWAHGYATLYERVTLELVDLAVRRPRPRVCPLCGRVYLPVRSSQSLCGNQIWDALSGKLVRRCTPSREAARYSAAEATEYRRRWKTRWAAMNRVRKKYGHGHPATERAIEEWEAWKDKNSPPRPRGRPPKVVSTGEPPYRPARDGG